ncbi:MAG: SRPBCC family protein, partial [Candidatus Dormibacteria bacterium]
MGRVRMVFGVALGAAAAASGAALVVRGDLAVDLGWGRRMRPLGPLFVDIAAPRQAVFEVVSAPYLKRTPR